MGGVIIIGSILFGLWYWGYFSSDNQRPGPDSAPGAGGSSSFNEPESTSQIFIRNNKTITEQIQEFNSQINTEQPLPDSYQKGQTLPSNDAVTEMNKRYEQLNNSNLNPESSSSSSNSSINRHNVLDKLDQSKVNRDSIITENRPDSPTGSTDSSETITPSSSSRHKGKGVIRRATSHLFR